MEAKEKLFMALKDNEALLKKIEEAWKANASEEAIKELLTDEGIQLDEDAMQELLAIRQQKALDEIIACELDEEQLSAVAGGGNGKCDSASDCDSWFQCYPFVPKDERCTSDFLCDELFRERCPKDWLAKDSSGHRRKKCTNYA